MNVSRFVSAGVVVACAGLAVAGGPNFSTTLGDPGVGGSNMAAFIEYDDGTGESLYAIGQFTIPGNPDGTNIARWDGSAWTNVGGGLQDSFSNVLEVYQGNLIAAGYFNSAGNVPGSAKLARWDGTNWNSMDAQSESFLNSFWDLAVWDDGITGEQLYIAGNYLDLNGQPGLNHIAKWDGSTYTEVGGTIGGAVPLIVLDVLPADLGSGSVLYAGGRFLNIDGVPALNIAQWDGTAWAPLGGGLTRTSGFAQVIHMTVWDDGSGPALYAGGTFNRADGSVVVSNVAKWDGSSWSSLGDGLDATVQELIAFDDGSGEALYAIGNFNGSGATPISRIAKWNGTSWEAVAMSVNGNAFGAIVADYGEGEALVIGGSFTAVDGLTANRVISIVADSACPADYNGDGTPDFFDVQAFLNDFQAMDPMADLTGDGIFDFFDVQAYLNLFGAGCP